LEEAMDVIKRGACFFEEAKLVMEHMHVTSLLDHMYGETSSQKLGLKSVMTKEEDTIVAWTLKLQKYGLSISL